MTPAPRLTIDHTTGRVRGIVLLLHGGRVTSMAPSPRGLAYLRMRPIARAIARSTLGRDTAVWRLRYRYRGWNAPHLHPVQDAHWALDVARREHPDIPVVLVGHSMGGRVALRVADSPGVAGVCALAPWIEAGEPIPPRHRAPTLIVHGDADRTTDPTRSASYATDAGAAFATVPNDGHAMLRRPHIWNNLILDFIDSTLVVRAEPGPAPIDS